MDGLDDLGGVDALQVHGRDAEIAVAQLALDDDQGHAFARELDCVGVAELVRRKAAPDAGMDGGPAQRRAGGGGRPVPAAYATR